MTALVQNLTSLVYINEKLDEREESVKVRAREESGKC